MRPYTAEYKFKRAEGFLEAVDTLVDDLRDHIVAENRTALLKALHETQKQLSQAHTKWEKEEMSHRKFASEYDH